MSQKDCHHWASSMCYPCLPADIRTPTETRAGAGVCGEREWSEEPAAAAAHRPDTRGSHRALLSLRVAQIQPGLIGSIVTLETTRGEGRKFSRTY